MFRILMPAVCLVLLLDSATASAQFRRGYRPYFPYYPRPWLYPLPYAYPYPVPYVPPQPEPPPPPQNTATIQVILPSTVGSVWVDDKLMSDQLADVRTFTTTPLEPGHNYAHTIKARWVARFQNVEQERQAIVRANGVTVVDFTKDAAE